MDRRQLLRSAAASLAAAMLVPAAVADERYPNRPIRLIVPRSSGGVVDVVTREWSEKVRTTLGASFVENIGGGGGRIGATAAARARPDGYTLLLGTTSELVLNPVLAPQPYDPVRDFTAIMIMSVSTEIIAVHPSVPAHDLKELVAYAKANPGKLNYGSAGAGSVSNLVGELFKQIAGLPDIVHIPYKGGNAALSDLIAGQITISTPAISGSVIDLHRAGNIRVLAVTSEQRLAAAPDLPTGIEQGFPGLVTQLFIGLFAPAGTPQPILDQIERTTRGAMQDKDLQAKLTAAGFETVTDSSPAKAAQYLQAEITRWTPVLKASGMKAE
jgi:tripartite-type tricarboxylate transporter receptor subunit TctC